MTAFLTRAGSGVPGDITRQAHKVVEQAMFDPDAVTASFGAPVKMVSGKIEKIEEGDTAADFYAVLTRLAPSIAGSTSESFGAGVPNASAVQGILRSGFINVTVTQGTPVRGQPVYMRIAAAVGKEVGDFETALVSDETVALTNVVFAIDGKDDSNVSEIEVSIR